MQGQLAVKCDERRVVNQSWGREHCQDTLSQPLVSACFSASFFFFFPIRGWLLALLPSTCTPHVADASTRRHWLAFPNANLKKAPGKDTELLFLGLPLVYSAKAEATVPGLTQPASGVSSCTS